MNKLFQLKWNDQNLKNQEYIETYIPKTKSPVNSIIYRENQMRKLLVTSLKFYVIAVN